MKKFWPYLTRIVGVAACLLVARSSAVADDIRWRSGAVELVPTTAAQVAEVLNQQPSLVEAGSGRHVVVQFSAAVTPEERGQLADAGLVLLSYLGDDAYFAAVAAEGVDQVALARHQSLRATAAIDPAWKLHPTLADGTIVPWSRIAPDLAAQASASPDAVAGEAENDDQVVAAYVLFHGDVVAGVAGVELVQRHGGEVRSHLRSVNGLVVELPYGEILPLAAEDAVQYIEPPLPKFSEMNDSNRLITGAEVAQAAPYGLDGTGVTVLVYDGGTVLTTHTDLIGRVQARDASGLADHSTHVAGIIGGDGTQSAGLYRGMAPGVMLESYGFETGGTLEAGFLYTDPGDIESDYDEAIHVYGADLSNNSIGTNTAPNGFPCEWTGDYGVTSALIDAIVRGSLGAPFRVIWANGNERQTERCGEFYATTAPPACAKNHISVGALNSNDDSVTDFTSWGPADDGRLKPDISAPGCQSDGDEGVTSTSSAGGYIVHCGTSMAAPTVSGLAALILQDYRATYPGATDLRNATLKALLAHTAEDVGNPGPDYQSGYGSVRVIAAIDHLRSGNFLERELAHGEVYELVVVVQPGDSALAVTLAWDDAPGTPNVDPSLINDLDLRVLGPGLVEYWPWTLDPNNPSAPAVRTQADHINNLEQVFIDNPAPGMYLVEVRATNVPEGPVQPFSLMASPQMVDCSPRGAAVLDRTAYRCQSTATVTVNDCDQDTNGLVADTITVTLTSETEPAGESLTLVETGPDTGRFAGSIMLDTSDVVGGLWVEAGDTVTVTYLDADDGFGQTNVVVTDTAVVDCASPVVANVATVDIAPEDARITFTTDEPTLAVARYGEDCAGLTGSVGAAGYLTAHDVLLEGLTDNQSYFYVIEATDAAGNTTIADNGGDCYTFTTEEIPDYFTQRFSGGFGLAYTAIMFVPDGSFGAYAACGRSITELPTAAATGTPLGLGDDDSARIALAGGAEVLLYGTGYGTLYVNANGNVTFDRADSDATEDYDDHFLRPRVAALWDDFNPGLRGEVRVQQFADRVVVTWDDVTEDYTANSNTAQAELYFDGRIQLAWLAVAANDGLVGLSRGIGVPPYFAPSDLTAFAACGPRAPTATPRTVIVGADRETPINLLASDDGMPDPPGGLSYTITALPAHTLRDAATGAEILPADLPYTLVSGNQVRYASSGFTGMDAFEFQVNDGGSPPDAGDSNRAVIAVQVDPVLGLPFFDGFATSTLDAGRWVDATNVTIDNAAFNEPSAPFSARFNGHPAGIDMLTTRFIDLSVAPAVRLAYYWQRTGGGNSPENGEDLVIEFLDNSGTWETLQQYPGEGPDMLAFESESLLLPASALHANFRLRFWTAGTVSGTSVLDDWFIDDVSLTVADAPIADNGWIAVAPNGMRDATLHASDPAGDPISFVVVALPAHGTLADPNGGMIGPVDLPYTLIGAGDVVRYVPDSGYGGTDAFTFLATDGAFDSNIATVNIMVEPVLTLPFSDTFPTAAWDSLKWSFVLGATVDTLGIAEPSGPFAARFNGLPDGMDQAYTYAIDLAGLGEVHVAYQWERTGGGDSPESGDDLLVEYVDRTGAWQIINRHEGIGVDMTTFAPADMVLPTAALHRDFRLRFRSNGDLGTYDDWFVDDVALYAVHEPRAFDSAVEVPRFSAQTIPLSATDPDGDLLDFIILSVPSAGVLTDVASATEITAGSLPYTLSGQGAAVHYAPPLGYDGQQALTFKVWDGAYESNVATVTVKVGGVQTAQSFPLNSDPGWSTEGLWAFGVPQGQLGDPVAGFTGGNVYGYNLNGRYTNAMPVHYLTTPPIDCSSLSDTQLSFQRWLGVEELPYDHATVQVSVDGVNWTTIWENGTTRINETAWSLQTYDIAALVDRAPAVQIRWGMGPTDGGVSYHGWNIDDIQLIGHFVPSSGDVDGDGDVDAVDQRVFAACHAGPGATPSPPDLMSTLDCLDAFDFDADGDVDLSDFAGMQAVWTLAAD